MTTAKRDGFGPRMSMRHDVCERGCDRSSVATADNDVWNSAQPRRSQFHGCSSLEATHTVGGFRPPTAPVAAQRVRRPSLATRRPQCPGGLKLYVPSQYQRFVFGLYVTVTLTSKPLNRPVPPENVTTPERVSNDSVT